MLLSHQSKLENHLRKAMFLKEIFKVPKSVNLLIQHVKKSAIITNSHYKKKTEAGPRKEKQK